MRGHVEHVARVRDQVADDVAGHERDLGRVGHLHKMDVEVWDPGVAPDARELQAPLEDAPDLGHR